MIRKLLFALAALVGASAYAVTVPVASTDQTITPNSTACFTPTNVPASYQIDATGNTYKCVSGKWQRMDLPNCPANPPTGACPGTTNGNAVCKTTNAATLYGCDGSGNWANMSGSGATVSGATDGLVQIKSGSALTTAPGFSASASTGNVSTKLLNGVLNVKGYGAVGDGTTDDTAAIQSAINACSTGPCTVYFPGAAYKTTTTLTVTHNRVTLAGDGPQNTRIIFTPAADDLPAISVSGDVSNIRYQCAVKNLTFDSADTTFRKIGIRLTHSSQTVLENVASNTWSGGSGQGSIGLQTRGREQLWARDLAIDADSPVSVEPDPYDANIHADHFHFENCIFSDDGKNTNPIIAVASGTYLANVSFDGTQSWNGGTYGFYWLDTATSASSLNIAFRNVRYEQSISNNWGWYISYHNTVLIKGLLFDNCGVSGNGHANGIYLRQVWNATLLNTRVDLSAGKTALDINTSDQNVVNINMNNVNNIGAETITSPSYLRLMGTDNPNGAQAAITMGGQLCLEGTTIDGVNLGCLTSQNITTPRTWTLPDATGQIPLLALSQSWSGLQSFSSVNMPHGASLPLTCSVGDAYFLTGVAVGQNNYSCTNTNTWTLEGDGGGGFNVNGSAVSGTPNLQNSGLVTFSTSGSNILGAIPSGALTDTQVNASAGIQLSKLATFSSAQLFSQMTTKTGTGSAVFGTGPTISSPSLNGFTASKCARFDATGTLVAATGDCTAGGGGTVSSVGLALPTDFTITNSPVTASGTLTGAWAAKPANLVLAGPVNGGAATPSFRFLNVTDIPAMPGTAGFGGGVPPPISSDISGNKVLRADGTWVSQTGTVGVQGSPVLHQLTGWFDATHIEGLTSMVFTDTGDVTVNSLTTADPGNGSRRLRLLNNASSDVADPGTTYSTIYAKGGTAPADDALPYWRNHTNGVIKILNDRGGDYGDFTCSAGTCTVDAGTVTTAKMAATAVTPASYTNTNLTVDAAGRITAASNGTGATTTSTATYFIDTPVTGDSGKEEIQLPQASTITRISCSTNVSTSTATINIDKRAETTPDTSGTNVLSAGLVCDTNAQTSCASGCDVNTITSSAVTARQQLTLTISAVANAPTALRVFVEYTTP